MTFSIFIGSSSEGLPVAKRVKECFEDSYEVSIWNEGHFQLNDSYLKSLITISNIFDFSVMVLTPDDLTISREKEKQSARDNLIFEQGLFLGKLGMGKAFLLCEENVELLSDYAGINVAKFKDGNEQSLLSACNEIRQRIESSIERANIQLLPSTSLALGYFENFLKKIEQKLLSSNEVIIDGKAFSYEDYEFIIYIPERISEVERLNLPRITKDFKDVKIETQFRDFPFYMKATEENSGTLRFYDFPTTLLTSRKAIKKLMDTTFFGEDEFQDKLEAREIYNFEMTLRHLISDEYGKENAIFKFVKTLKNEK